jgi:hypothetical protein
MMLRLYACKMSSGRFPRFTIAPSWRRYSVCQQEPSSYSQSHPQEEIANCNFGPQGEIDLAGGGTRSHRKIRSLKIGRKG